MTAIATIYRTGEIVIAADSMRFSPTTGEQKSVCKIRPFGTFFAAVSGIQDYPDTGYNLQDLLSAQMPEGDLLNVVQTFQQVVLPRLNTALNHSRQNKPDFFEKYGLVGSPLTITVAHVENKVPKLANLTVSVQITKDDSIALTTWTARRPAGFFPSPWYGFVGTPEGVLEAHALAQNGQMYIGNLVERAKGLVQMEIEKETPGIGGPIDILRLTEEGATWVQKKKEC